MRIAPVLPLVASLVVCPGCMAVFPPAMDSPAIVKPAQMISAGHTGCLPEENVISNAKLSTNGSGTWNATCRGKTYLCSTYVSGNTDIYSCAPVAQ